MEYKYSNVDEFNRAIQQHALMGDRSDDFDVELKERFWTTFDQFPKDYSKQSIQKRFYSQKEQVAGHVLLTLRQVADQYGRPLRRFVSEDKEKLNDYLDNDYHFLFVDIDELGKYDQKEKELVTYDDMVELVKSFKSPDFPEVYVRPSHSTDKKPPKFHLYVLCREPYYYRVVVGPRKRMERENSRVLSEEKMTQKFLRAFMDYFPAYFATHQFAKVDTSLYSIHQCIHGAPANDISKVTRNIIPGTVPGFVPCINKKRDPFYGVPPEYLNSLPYPCNASMRYKAWNLTFLPYSFDVRLPSQWNGKKVGDGRRRAFARVLARDLWVAVRFNLHYYPEYAEPYDRRRLYNMIMREFYVGADRENLNVPLIESTVEFVITEMEKDMRPIDEIIDDLYADTVKYDESGKIVRDYNMIRHPDRKSHEHVPHVIGELEAEGIIKRSRFTICGAELEKILADKHVTKMALKKRGVKPFKERKKRSDCGKKRAERSVWADYVYLCRRDMDGRIVVTKDVGEIAAFRKYCSLRPVKYVSSSLPGDDPLNVDRVANMPQDAPCEAPWGIVENG